MDGHLPGLVGVIGKQRKEEQEEATGKTLGRLVEPVTVHW